MKKPIMLSAVAAGLGMLTAVPAAPQTPTEPRRVIKIIREEVKPGREAAHERVEAGYVRTLSKVKYPHYLGLQTVTGPSEAWFVEPYESFAAVGAAREAWQNAPAVKAELDQLDARDGEVRTGGRVMLALYQKDLSLRGEQFVARIPHMRFVSITMARIRPGRAADYARMRKLFNAAAADASPNASRLVYQVTSGAPMGTYLVIRGLASLQELDPDPAQKPLLDSMSQESRQEFMKLAGEVVLNSENLMFAVNPAISYPSKQTVEGDPAFWKPAPAAVPRKATAGQ